MPMVPDPEADEIPEDQPGINGNGEAHDLD